MKRRKLIGAGLLACICGLTSGCVQSTVANRDALDLSSEMALALPDSVGIRPWTSDQPEPEFGPSAYAEPAQASAAANAIRPLPSDPDLPATAEAPPAEAQPARDPVVATVSAAGNGLAAAASYVEAAVTPRPLSVTPAGREELDGLIRKYALLYDVPEELVRAVVRRESNFNPSAYNRGHWGLMQIKHATARGMGYRGPPGGLLDAETNLKYAVKYLKGAYMVAEGDHRKADRLYQRGYYYDAKRKGLLDETGLGRDRVRRRSQES